MEIFEINPDIKRAETLSSEFYTNEKYFRQSREKIFARSWQLIGRADEIENLKPHTILEDFLDEPVLLVKNGEKIKCLSNVCTHRGNLLIESACRADRIRCRYHGRRFDLNGKFLSMPEFEKAENFPTAKDNLPEIPFGNWQDFLFASINPFAPFAEFFREIGENRAPFEFKELKFTSARDYCVKAHWALYCENYLEGFHIPFVHKALNEELDYGSYQTEIFRFSVLQTGFDDRGEIAARYFFVFPNLMFNFYPWGISVNIVKPLKKDLTRISYLTFVGDQTKLDKGAGADLETVEFEDQAVVEAVQKGINSRFYAQGRYSPARERGIHYFHRLVAEFLSGD
jgi:choline monooxygenase